ADCKIARVDWPAGGKTAAAALADEPRLAGIQIVHANSLMTAEAAFLLADRLHAPAVVHVRDVARLSRARVERLGGAAAVVAVSPAVADSLVEQGLPAARVWMIPNAVASVDQPITPVDLTKELNLPPATRFVGCVGQIALRKGQDLFLTAVERLAADDESLHFVIVGERHSVKEESVEYERRLRAASNEGSAAGRVHWLGYRADSAAVLAALTVVVVPSRQEPLSRVILESLAGGTPVAATEVGGSRYLLTDAEGEPCGVLTPPGDAAALADAAALLLADQALRGRLVARGRRRAGDFSPGRQADAILTLYDSIVRSDAR
ncbi:MAG: glycosyltransferase, partial [Planctomycetia bacterium]